MTAPQPGEIEVEDQLERRIRKPVDLVRCALSCTEIVVLAVAGITASATMAGVETDVADASRRLPHALLVVAPPLALFALLVLPVAMAVQLLVRRQFRRLAEAAATGVLAAAMTAVASDLLTGPAAGRLYYAIIMARPGASHAATFDPYLAALVAYATMVGLAGWPYWRNALWAAIAVYAIVHVAARHTSILTLLITVIGGRAIGLAVRYFAGSASQRPGARDIAAALAAAGLPVTVIRRVRRQEPRQGNPSRHYAVTTKADGCRLDVVVYDRDQQAAGAIYRLYRRVRVRGQVSRNAPLSVDRAVERRALPSYAGEEAGAPTPRLRAVVRVGPDASVLAYEHHDGTTLARRNPGGSDAELSQI
jgi:glycosyltransferase 2 family protein